MLFVLFCILKIIMLPSKVEDLKRKREEEEKKVSILYFCKKTQYFPKMVFEMMDEH